jgi:hypothetical protein
MDITAEELSRLFNQTFGKPVDMKHNPRVNYAEEELEPELGYRKWRPAGATLNCDCGLWMFGSVDAVRKAYEDHIRVTDPTWYSIICPNDNESECA